MGYKYAAQNFMLTSQISRIFENNLLWSMSVRIWCDWIASKQDRKSCNIQVEEPRSRREWMKQRKVNKYENSSKWPCYYCIIKWFCARKSNCLPVLVWMCVWFLRLFCFLFCHFWLFRWIFSFYYTCTDPDGCTKFSIYLTDGFHCLHIVHFSAN